MAGVLGALQVATRILAARFILLLAVVGAIALAVLAVSGHDYLGLIASAGYMALVVGPLVWLVSRS